MRKFLTLRAAPLTMSILMVGLFFGVLPTEAQSTLCGSANGQWFFQWSPPSSNLCVSGSTMTGFASHSQSLGNGWEWYCLGTNASYQCRAFLDAACGSASGRSFAGSPSDNLCSSGSPTPVTRDGSYWLWNCQSYTGTQFSPAPPNDTDQCSANVMYPSTPPSCGWANGGSFEGAPSNGLCGNGNLKSGPTATGNGWSWVCEETPSIVISPSPPLATVECSAGRITIPPSCGSANGGNFTATPTNNLCSVGTAANGPTRNGASWTWSCETGSGSTNCSANWQPTLPACGNAQGSWSVRAPRDSDLCSTGTAGAVSQGSTSGNPSWNWTCTNDGREQTCNAWIQPTCGSANGSEQAERPTANLCATGNPSAVVENSASGWSWDCLNNADPAHGANCSSTRPAQNNPVCGNGTVETGEECDDGNRNDRDGCSSLCRTETPTTPPVTPPAEPPKTPERPESETCDASIGDIVWNDLNKNGIQDNGEGGISGITVKLLNGDKVDKDKTNDEGKYSFKDLCKGSYRITVDANDIREGCYPTYDRDRDLDHSTTAKIKNDEKYRDADFGYYCPTAPRTGTGAVAIAISATLAGLAVIFGRRFLKLR